MEETAVAVYMVQAYMAVGIQWGEAAGRKKRYSMNHRTKCTTEGRTQA
jgi:hypothetical protein